MLVLAFAALLAAPVGEVQVVVDYRLTHRAVLEQCVEEGLEERGKDGVSGDGRAMVFMIDNKTFFTFIVLFQL